MSQANETQNTQIDEILEIDEFKQTQKPKKQINPSESLQLLKLLKQSKEQITQQSYQDAAYILTKLPIFEYVYSIKGLSFITQFLKTGKIMEINENNTIIFENKENYKQRFFLLIKGSVAFEGTIKKRNKQNLLSKYNIKSSQNQSQVFVTSNQDDNNQQKFQLQNAAFRLNSQESEYDIDFDDTKSALFRLDTRNSDTDQDEDCISISSFGTNSKKSFSPRQQYENEGFLPSKFNNFQIQKNSVSAQKGNIQVHFHHSEIRGRGNSSYNQSHNYSQSQDDQMNEYDDNQNQQKQNNYVIQVSKPLDNTPQNQSVRCELSHNSRRSSQKDLEFQQSDLQADNFKQFLDIGSNKKIQSQRAISIPNPEKQNKIRSNSQASKRRGSNVSNCSQSKYSNSGSKNIISSQIDSQRSQNQKYGNSLFAQNNQKSNQSSIMKKRSSFLNSAKQSNNNSMNASQLLNNQHGSQKSLLKISNLPQSSQKKQRKTQQTQLIERFKVLSGVATFGHKLKYGRSKIQRIITASDKCVLISFEMKDFEDLIYGLNESDPKIKFIQNLINKQHLFKGCSFRQINNLTLMSRKIEPYKNEIIYSQNDKSKGLYLIVKGEVKVLIDIQDEDNNNELKQEENSRKTLISFKQQGKLIHKAIQNPIADIQQQAEEQTHELFIHKNKNKFQSSQLKFNEQHRKEVGILDEGNFFGLEDLVLGQNRSSTIQVNGKETEIIYMPLDSSDIFTYLDDEEKYNILLNAQEIIEQRKARAISNNSFLASNQMSSTQIVTVNKVTNDLNNSKYFLTQQSFNHQVNQENASSVNNNRQTNRSLSPKLQQTPLKNSQNIQTSNGHSILNQKMSNTHKEGNSSNIQVPPRFSKVAKLDDMLQRYPYQQKATPKKQQVDIMVNNMFLASEQSAANEQNKSLKTMNSQKSIKRKRPNNNQDISQLLKTNISITVNGSTPNNTQQIKQTQKEEIVDSQEKTNDLIQYYNQKQIQDAKSLKMKRRSLSCFIEGENNDQTEIANNIAADNQVKNPKKQATTLDPKDIKEEDIIWKKDIIMSNTEYSHLKIQIPSQTSINNQKAVTVQSSKYSDHLNVNQAKRDIQINPNESNDTVSFSNNLIISNLSVQHSNKNSQQKKLGDEFKYPVNKSDLQRNNNIPIKNLRQKSGGSLVDEKLNSITNQYIQLKIPIKSTQNKSKQDFGQINLQTQKSNHRYKQKDKSKSFQYSSNVPAPKVQDQDISQNTSMQINQMNENILQARTALSTASKPQRTLKTSAQNRMSAPNERSFRIQQNKLKNQEQKQEISKHNQDNINNLSMFEQNSTEFLKGQERSQSSQAHARIKVLSRYQNRQQQNQIFQSQTVKTINMNEAQDTKNSRNQSRLSPHHQREFLNEKKYNTENCRNLKQMNTTAQSYLTMKNMDSYNMNVSQVSTSLSKRPTTKGSQTRKPQLPFGNNTHSNFNSKNEKSLSEMKMKQEFENLIVNPQFKLSNNFHFIKKCVQEEEGILDGDEYIENQIFAKKNILNHLQQFSNKASQGKEISQSELRKSYVQKYIYPEDEFAREADQKIKLQMNKLEEGKDLNPYLFNTKFEHNSQTSLMLFYNYIKRKLKHVHKNEILYSKNQAKASSQDQIRPYQVQNSTAVKNNLRKYKKFYKKKIQEYEQLSNQYALYNTSDLQQSFLEQNISEDHLYNNPAQTNNYDLPYDIYIETNNELGQINEKFSKTPIQGSSKTQKEIQQRQKEILTQIKSQNYTIKKNGSLPTTPAPQFS